MDLSTIRQVCKGRYGLDRSATADAFFSDAVLNDCINEAHRALAAACGCYESDSLSLDLASGTAEYDLDATVIRPKAGTFRMSYDSGAYAQLFGRRYESLLSEVGPFEALADAEPTAFILRQRSGAEGYQLRFVPAPAATATVKYAAWVYPPTLTADGDTPALPAAEHDRLINAVCRRMAQRALAAGTDSSPVQQFFELEQADLAAMQQLYHQPGFRSSPAAVRGR